MSIMKPTLGEKIFIWRRKRSYRKRRPAITRAQKSRRVKTTTRPSGRGRRVRTRKTIPKVL